MRSGSVAGLVPSSDARTREQREARRIARRGLHWDVPDEDVSVARLLAGLGGQAWRVAEAAQ